MIKNLPANAEDTGDVSSIPVGKIPWRRKWQPTPVFLSGKSHEWRRLAGYSPWGLKEYDTTEHINLSKRVSIFLPLLHPKNIILSLPVVSFPSLSEYCS